MIKRILSSVLALSLASCSGVEAPSPADDGPADDGLVYNPDAPEGFGTVSVEVETVEPSAEDSAAIDELFEGYDRDPNRVFVIDALGDSHGEEEPDDPRIAEIFGVPDVEKANSVTAVGMGWPLKGTLTFQDTIPNLATSVRDHCELWGLDCDEEWHIQANFASASSITEFPAQVRTGKGGCGRMNLNAWYPCAYANMSGPLDSIGRTLKWRYIDTACGTSAQKSHIRAGITLALSYFDTQGGMNFTETTGTDWNLLFDCAVFDGFSTEAIARWGIRNNMPLRGAVATADGTPTAEDTCEASGLPGSSPVSVYNQGIDMVYTYNQSEIQINVQQMFAAVSCASGSGTLRNGIRSVMLHELGHWMGMPHTPQHNDPFTGIMYNNVSTCANLTGIVRNFSQEYLWSIQDNNWPVDADGIDVWDNDLSCYNITP